MYRLGIPLLCCLSLSQDVLSDGVTDQRAVTPQSATLPVIDLKRLEPQVSQQLASVQTLLVELTARTDTTQKQRADAYGEFGRLLHAYGYAEEAVACYRQSTALQSNEPRWWHLLGCASESAGKLVDAERALRHAHKLQPDYAATAVRLGNVLLQLNRRDEAQQLFAGALKDNPKLAAAYAGLGTIALEHRDYRTAVVHLTQAIEIAPAANSLHYSLAMAYRGLGDIDRAREQLRLRGAVSLRPDDPLMDELPQLLRGTNVHQMRGRLALSAGALKDAIREYRKAIEAAPESVPARVNLAAALIRTKATDEAIEHLEVAVHLDPKNTNALFNLASLRATQGDYTATAALLHSLLDMEPKDLEARRHLARAHLGLRQPDEAIKILRDARLLAPDDEPTMLLLAEVLTSQKQHADAMSLLTEVHQAHPDRGLTAHALARLLVECPDAALRDGRRALALAKNVYDARPTVEHGETFAMALAAVGRFEEAVSLQKQLIAAVPHQRAPTLIERLQANLRRYEQHEIAR